MKEVFAAIVAIGLPVSLCQADPPALPPGLEPISSSPDQRDRAAPALPAGLGIGIVSNEGTPVAPEEMPRKATVKLDGFVESRWGSRLQSDPNGHGETLSELRLQTRLSGLLGSWDYRLSQDWIYDSLADDRSIDLNTGRGWMDTREAWIGGRVTDFLDLKAGRQIATWGTGDLLFVSDLFPKDWQAFILGRDEDYLKAPSDAIKASLFSDWVNLDFVYTPEFDADRFITGERLSFYDPSSDRLAGGEPLIDPEYPNDSERALRLYRNFRSAELALYAYDGYWKQPTGFDPRTGRAAFSKLQAISLSGRRPLWGGLANFEGGHYDSQGDPDGTIPFVRNSETRWLVGYEREVASNLTGSVQYYRERMSDYSAYLGSIGDSDLASERSRSVATLRLTKLMRMQTLRLSFFAFYSPSDQDGFIRPSVHYTLNDDWSTSAGVNWLFGTSERTFFGQLEKNSNAYFSLKRSF